MINIAVSHGTVQLFENNRSYLDCCQLIHVADNKASPRHIIFDDLAAYIRGIITIHLCGLCQ